MRYILYSKDEPLLEFDIKGSLVEGVNIIGKVALLPEILKSGREAALQHWLSTRGIDTTRTNARVLLKELHVKSDRVTAVIFNKGLNMTDCYWIKDTEKNNDESFQELSLYRKENIRTISALSLSGRAVRVPTVTNHEITSIGSFNKAWIKEEDEWWLYKKGNIYNNYAELFTYEIGKLLGINMAEYKFEAHNEIQEEKPLIASHNFTNEEIMLEHYDSFRYRFDDVELEDDEVILQNFESIGLGKAYRDMIMLDALVSNVDRHEYNFGVLKSTATGEVLGFAPYFDHNLALNAHLDKEVAIGLGLLRLCEKTVGKKILQQFTNGLTMQEIEQINQKVIRQLGTDQQFEFVMKYMNEVLEWIR